MNDGVIHTKIVAVYHTAKYNVYRYAHRSTPNGCFASVYARRTMNVCHGMLVDNLIKYGATQTSERRKQLRKRLSCHRAIPDEHPFATSEISDLVYVISNSLLSAVTEKFGTAFAPPHKRRTEKRPTLTLRAGYIPTRSVGLNINIIEKSKNKKEKLKREIKIKKETRQ